MSNFQESSQELPYLELSFASHPLFKSHFNQDYLSTIKSHLNQNYQIDSIILEIIMRITLTSIINCKSSIQNYKINSYPNQDYQLKVILINVSQLQLSFIHLVVLFQTFLTNTPAFNFVFYEIIFFLSFLLKFLVFLNCKEYESKICKDTRMRSLRSMDSNTEVCHEN